MIKDTDVYEYRRQKEVKLFPYIVKLRKEDTSIKKSIKTSIGYIDIYIYYPDEIKSKSVYFNLHGGGMVLGYYQLDQPYCQLLAKLSHSVIINIDYVVAPEYKFPLTYTTTYEVIKWCYKHSKELRISNKNFMVGGNSAGGNIAAAMIQLANKDKFFNFSGLVQNYPECDQNIKSSDIIDPKKIIKPSRVAQYKAWEYKSPEEETSPLASPINSDPRIYPSTLINTAEFDSLERGAREFGQHLKDAGVSVDYKMYKNCQHGFTHRDLKEYNQKASEDAWNRIAKFIYKTGKDE